MRSWKDHPWHSVNCQRVRIEDIVRRASGYVLDAGCNEGFLTRALQESGCDVVSVDNDDDAIAKARLQFGIEVIKADVNDLPFPTGIFDLVIGGELLEHLENPGRGLQEMFRVSRGWVIFTVPVGAYWLGEKSHRWQVEATAVEHDHGVLRHFDKELLIIEFIKRKT